MKILFVAGEGGPFFKTGGLGDVIGSLPKALVENGVDVSVMLPYYQAMPDQYKKDLKDTDSFYVNVGSKSMYCGIKQLVLDNVTYYFIDNENYFFRENLYGYWDDGERFAFFAMACCEAMERVNFIPDILHVHDWHAAMIPVLLVHKYHWIDAYKHIRKVLTIHNLKFQGIYDSIMLDSVFNMGYDAYHDMGLKHFDQINYLKGGIHYSDIVTTVSPSYANEIQTFEFGEHLDGDLILNSWKVRGILNGISLDDFNPKTDQLIAYHLRTSIPRYKKINKLELQKSVGLNIDNEVALLGMVSRLTDQKGVDLLIESMHEIMHRNVQVIILGTGDPKFEKALTDLAKNYPNRLSVLIQFDLKIAQNIYAGSDIFLMPSAFEPCGLSQMMAFRFGSIPLVHETGGLRDTVVPYNPYTKEGTGFSFSEFSQQAFLEVLDIALTTYYDDPKTWLKLVEDGMELDFSWDVSVKAYIEMYNQLL